MILNLLVVVVSLASVSGLALVAANPEAARESRDIFKRHAIVGMPVGCLTAIFGLITLGLWTWYAIDQGDWRYAAIAWIPGLCTWLGRLATGKYRR